MIKSRQAVIFSAVGVLLALCSAAQAATTVALYRPNPDPPCGDYIDDCPKPWDKGNPDRDQRYHILSGLGRQTSELSKAVQGGNLDKAGEGLSALFTGSAAKSGGSEVGAVYAGASSQASSAMTSTAPEVLILSGSARGLRGIDEVVVPSMIVPKNDEPEKGYGKGNLRLAGLTEVVGGVVVKVIVEKGIEKANEAIEKHVERDQTQESIERYGGCRVKGTCDK